MATTLITSETLDVRRREARLPRDIPDVAFLDLTKGFFEFDDFLARKHKVSGENKDSTSYLGLAGWSQYTSGNATTSVSVGQATAPGILQLMAPKATNLSAVFKHQEAIVAGGGMQIEFMVRFQIPVLNDATNTSHCYFGFGDTFDTDAYVDGVYIHYDPASIYFRCECSRASVITSSTTTVQVVAGQWYTAKAVIAHDGSKVDFYIGTTGDNMALVATITTNIPTGTSYAFGPNCKIYKLTGQAEHYLLLDYYVFSGSIVGGR